MSIALHILQNTFTSFITFKPANNLGRYTAATISPHFYKYRSQDLERTGLV